MKQHPSQYLDRDYVMKGGMVRHLSIMKHVNAGFWIVKGMQGNDEDALTKVNGSELYCSENVGGRITGLFQVTLGNVVYAIVMANGKILRVSTGDAIELITGQNAGYYDGRTLQSVFYAVSGTNPNKKILTDLSVQGVGIEAPLTALVAAVGIAGPNTGDYSWKYTYKNTTTGHESNPSPVSNTLTMTSDKADLTSIDVSADPQVDAKVIYRTTADGDGLWFRVAEIAAAATTFTDDIEDDDLSELVFEDNGVPPQCSLIEIFNGMMIYAGQAAPNRNRVSISGVLRPEAVDPDNDQDLEPDEEDHISGLKRFGSALAVYKKRRIFMGSGKAPDEMEFVPTRVRQGSLGNAIIDFNSSHYYLSQQGPMVFSGLREEFIGRPIQQFYKGLDPEKLANASGCVYEPLNQLIWNVQEEGQSDFNTWLCLNTETKEWTIRDHATSRLAVYFDAIGNIKLWLGAVDGYLYTGDTGTGDNGATILCQVVTRGFCLSYVNKQPDLSQTYNFRHLEILYDANGGSTPVTVQVAIDKPDANYQSVVNASTGLSTFLPTTGNKVRFDMNQQGRLLFVKFTVATTEDLVIRGIRLQGIPLGRR